MKYKLFIYDKSSMDDRIYEILNVLKQSDGIPSFTWCSARVDQPFYGKNDRRIEIESDEFPYWIIQVLRMQGVYLDGEKSYFFIGSDGYAYSNNPRLKFYIPDFNKVYGPSFSSLTDESGQDLSEIRILEILPLNNDDPDKIIPSPVWNPYKIFFNNQNFFVVQDNDPSYVFEQEKIRENMFARLRAHRQPIKQEHSKRLLERINRFLGHGEERTRFTSLEGNPVLAAIKDIRGIVYSPTDDEQLEAIVLLANVRINVDLQKFAKEVINYEDPESLSLPTSLAEKKDYAVLPAVFDYDQLEKIAEEVECAIKRRKRRE